jgi:hypothetical protein
LKSKEKQEVLLYVLADGGKRSWTLSGKLNITETASAKRMTHCLKRRFHVCCFMCIWMIKGKTLRELPWQNFNFLVKIKIMNIYFKVGRKRASG